MAGLKYLADIPRGGVAKLEQHFALFVDGLYFHGFIDLRHVRRVLDHKTTKDIPKYALSPEQLAADLQRTIYSAGTLDGFVIEHAPDGTELGVTDEPLSVGLDGTDCRWVYYATVHHRGSDKSEWADAREHSESRSETAQRMGDVVLPLARKLLPLWDAPAADFDRDLRRCEDYGGCPYQDKCWKDDPPTRAERAKGAEMSTTLERLKAKRAAEAAAAAGAAPPAASEPESDVSFSPDQKPASAPTNATTPPAGPPVSKPSDGPRTPPKKRTSSKPAEQAELPTNAGGAEPEPEPTPEMPDPETPIVLPLHRKLPVEVVLRVVTSCTSSEQARDMLEVVADWTGDA